MVEPLTTVQLIMEPETKRKRVEQAKDLEVGDSVRLVNLPAFPGLEGLTAVITALTDEFADVEIEKTKVVKRLRRDKVRKMHVGYIVELHGLVAAYKLNGRIGECVGYDETQQRYDVLLSSGETKKVKPQNVEAVAKFRSDLVNAVQLRTLLEERKISSGRAGIAHMLLKWNCVLPTVISAKVLIDWTKLDDVEMQRKLLSSKKVEIATLAEKSNVVFLSLPRKRLADNTLYSDVAFVKAAITACKDELERRWNLNHLYVVVSTQAVAEAELPMVKRGIECSFPLWFALVDAIVLALWKTEDLSSLRYASQRMDVACSHKFGADVLLVNDGKLVRDQRIKLSLPSRGSCEDDQVNAFKEIEKCMSIERPADKDVKAYIKTST